MMNAREKLRATVFFDRSCPPPLYEMNYWAETALRWYGEGLPRVQGLPYQARGGEEVGGALPLKPIPFEDICRVARFDSPVRMYPLDSWIYPPFEPRVIEDQGDRVIIVDDMGITKRMSTADDSIPEYLAWPVRTRKDWEKLKEERLDPRSAGRCPFTLPELSANFNNRDYPLRLGGHPVGYFGSLRYLMGEVSLFTTYYDDPGLIRTIIADLTEFWMQLWAPYLSRVTPDLVTIWEDMCYKTGSLISPAHFREFMLPAYKKLSGFLRDHGVDIVLLDTDGNCWELIPLFIEGGVNFLYPMEAAAAMNVVEVRGQFPRLAIAGGIDKRALIAGRSAIDRELGNKVPAMLELGGYIPHVDHAVPPDISLENFLYYRRRLEELIADKYPDFF